MEEKELDTSKFTQEWKDLFKCLRDPKATVGDVQGQIEIFSKRPHIIHPDNRKPVPVLYNIHDVKGGLIAKLDTIMVFFLNGKSDKINEYLKCRYAGDSNSAFVQNIGKALCPSIKDNTISTSLKNAINTYLNDNSFNSTTTVPEAFEKIKDIIKTVSSIKSLCESTKVDEFFKFINEEFLNQSASAAQSNTPKEETILSTVKEAIENSEKKQVIFTGAPGTGKTFSVEEYVKRETKQEGKEGSEHPRWEFVQFHSSYDYTDFVEGLRPVQKDGKMVFVRMDGIFKAFCRRVAEADKLIDDENAKNKDVLNVVDAPQKEYDPYYFIIDEINRADLGRVFGELMYCFEKRGSGHAVKTQYHNLHAYDLSTNDYLKNDVFENGFYIPENVIILGTMNDIDRSVETFDFALRRRFDWVEIKADEVMKDALTAMGCDTDIVDDIKKMNNIIANRPGLGKAFAIGPAYFKGYKGNTPEERKNCLETIWERNIEPILREYMRGRQAIDVFVNECHSALFSPPHDEQDSETEVDSGEQS